MSTVQRISELLKNLPEKEVSEVLDFVEFLNYKLQLNGDRASAKIPKGTLTGLRGIAKTSNEPLSDEEIREAYTDYLSRKYE